MGISRGPRGVLGGSWGGPRGVLGGQSPLFFGAETIRRKEAKADPSGCRKDGGDRDSRGRALDEYREVVDDVL